MTKEISGHWNRQSVLTLNEGRFSYGLIQRSLDTETTCLSQSIQNEFWTFTHPPSRTKTITVNLLKLQG
jgi:hypothetical protein